MHKSCHGVFAISILSIAGGSASAATINVGDSATQFTNSLTPTHTISNFEVDAGDDRKLVLMLSSETASTVTSVKYGTQDFELGVTSGGTRFSRIYYLDNPTVGTADVVVSWSGNARSRMSVIELTNAQAGGPAVSNQQTGGGSTTGTQVDLTTTSDDTLVFLGVQQNGSSSPSLVSGFTNISNGGAGSSATRFAYKNEATAGSFTYDWTGAGDGGAAVAGFIAVPEPSSLALLGLGGLLIGRRYR